MSINQDTQEYLYIQPLRINGRLRW